MRFTSKQSLIFVQSLVLLLALVAVDAGSAVQVQSPIMMVATTEAASVTEANTNKIRSHRCAVWASCNGQRQTVQLNHKKALLLAVAVGLNQSS